MDKQRDLQALLLFACTAAICQRFQLKSRRSANEVIKSSFCPDAICMFYTPIITVAPWLLMYLFTPGVLTIYATCGKYN